MIAQKWGGDQSESRALVTMTAVATIPLGPVQTRCVQGQVMGKDEDSPVCVEALLLMCMLLHTQRESDRSGSPFSYHYPCVTEL